MDIITGTAIALAVIFPVCVSAQQETTPVSAWTDTAIVIEMNGSSVLELIQDKPGEVAWLTASEKFEYIRGLFNGDFLNLESNQDNLYNRISMENGKLYLVMQVSRPGREVDTMRIMIFDTLVQSVSETAVTTTGAFKYAIKPSKLFYEQGSAGKQEFMNKVIEIYERPYPLVELKDGFKGIMQREKVTPKDYGR